MTNSYDVDHGLSQCPPGALEPVEIAQQPAAPAAPGVSTVEDEEEPPRLPYVVQRILKFAGQNQRFVTLPNLSAQQAIDLANWIQANLRPAPAAGDALDAARYRQLRKALTSFDTGWLDRIATALEAMGLDPDEDKLPTPEQVDGAFDAAQRKGDA